MSAPKLTPWFPASVKPVRAGVYWTRLLGDGSRGGYSFWNGRYWGNELDTIENAKRYGGIGLSKEWRGLAERPKVRA